MLYQKTKQKVIGSCQIHDLWIKITFKSSGNQLLSGNRRPRSNLHAIRVVKIPQNPSINSNMHTTSKSLQRDNDLYNPKSILLQHSIKNQEVNNKIKRI